MIGLPYCILRRGGCTLLIDAGMVHTRCIRTQQRCICTHAGRLGVTSIMSSRQVVSLLLLVGMCVGHGYEFAFSAQADIGRRNLGHLGTVAECVGET